MEKKKQKWNEAIRRSCNEMRLCRVRVTQQIT